MKFEEGCGFETTDCLECLQILDILIYGRRVCFKAGDWTLCIILGYGLPERETFCMPSFALTYSILLSTICCADGPPLSPERETCCILSINQLSHAYFLTKWKKCNILSLFLLIHIVESTIPRRSSIHPFFPEGNFVLYFPFWRNFSILSF